MKAITKISLCTAALALLITATTDPLTLAAAHDPPGSPKLDHLLQEWLDAWNSHDDDRILAVFTDDIFYEDLVLMPDIHNSAQLRAFADAVFTAIPDAFFTVERGFISGDRGLIEGTFSGTDVGVLGTGKPFAVRFTVALEVHGGKISRESDYYDFATILRQIGAL